jgi:hypothetical protein
MDTNDDGIVDINDLKSCYNANRHPDVMQGKRSEATVLSEFLESFEEHHQLYCGASSQKNNQVTLEEFMEYYMCVGTLIENDETFSIMVSNCWSLTGGGGGLN